MGREGLKGRDSSGSLSGTAAPEALAGMRTQSERGYNPSGCKCVPAAPCGKLASLRRSIGRRRETQGAQQSPGGRLASPAAPREPGIRSSRALLQQTLVLVGPRAASGEADVEAGSLAAATLFLHEPCDCRRRAREGLQIQRSRSGVPDPDLPVGAASLTRS
jgi:hypothetical protein